MRLSKLAITFFAVNLFAAGLFSLNLSSTSNDTASLKASSRHAIIIADGSDPMPKPPKA
jgi:hypothetical protein